MKVAGTRRGQSPMRTLPPAVGSALGGALSAVRAQCNYLGVWP